MTHWDPESPMYWHRSARHRAVVIALVAAYFLALAFVPWTTIGEALGVM